MTIEKPDTKELFEAVDKTTMELVQLISSFSQKDINAIPFEDSWTAAQVADHLLKSYAVVETLNGPVKKTERQPGEKIQMIREVFLNFDTKMNSPEAILPAASPIDKETILRSLKSRIAQIKEVIQTRDLSETCTGFIIPGFEEFTRLEWIHFVLYHTQRHIHQMKNIFEMATNK